MKNETIVRAMNLSSALSVTALLTCITLLQEATSAVAKSPLPGHAQAFGQGLAEWQELYWRWAFGQAEVPIDHNANAVMGNIVLMPLPNAPGDGTPGTIDVTLDPGQPFVLPLWNVLGTSYDDGTPDDPVQDLSIFESLDISLVIDGDTVIDSENVLQYYSEVLFNPEIPLPPEFSPYLAIVKLQGIGIVHAPLSAGHGGGHTITLDVKNTIPVLDSLGNEYIFEYHNTWNIIVQN